MNSFKESFLIKRCKWVTKVTFKSYSIFLDTDLFKDLVKLSHGDATEPESGDDMLVSPKVTQNNNSSPLPQNINIKIEENAEDQSKQKNAPEISLEEVLSMVEKTNNVLADFKTTQDGFLKKIQELSQEAKHMEYLLNYFYGN